MSKFRTSLLTLASVAAIFGATSASAASFEVWNGSAWVSTGTTNFTGPTTALYLGNPAPCDANFAVSITGGVATVTSATFTGSSTCTGIVSSTPWTMSAPTPYTGANPPFAGAPTLTGPLYSVSIGGVRIYLPPPLNVNCPSATGTGTVTGVLDATGRFVFKSTLGPCAVQTRTNAAPNALVANPAVRVVP